MHQLEADQIAEGCVKHDAHAREYYVQVVNEWLDSPFITYETPQSWLKFRNSVRKWQKQGKKTGYNVNKVTTNTYALSAPKRNGSTFIYVLLAVGDHRFTGFGITTKPFQRVQNHTVNLQREGCRAVKYSWFETDANSAKIIEKAIGKEFPVIQQPVESFRTEATYYENHNDICKFVAESIEQRDYFAKIMKQILTPVQSLTSGFEDDATTSAPTNSDSRTLYKCTDLTY